LWCCSRLLLFTFNCDLSFSFNFFSFFFLRFCFFLVSSAEGDQFRRKVVHEVDSSSTATNEFVVFYIIGGFIWFSLVFFLSLFVVVVFVFVDNFCWSVSVHKNKAAAPLNFQLSSELKNVFLFFFFFTEETEVTEETLRYRNSVSCVYWVGPDEELVLNPNLNRIKICWTNQNQRWYIYYII